MATKALRFNAGRGAGIRIRAGNSAHRRARCAPHSSCAGTRRVQAVHALVQSAVHVDMHDRPTNKNAALANAKAAFDEH